MPKLINAEKAMADAINAVAQLSFKQLLLLNAHVGEHMHNCMQQAELNAAKQQQKENRAQKRAEEIGMERPQ